MEFFKLLAEAIDMAQRIGRVLMGAADAKALPHMTMTGPFTGAGDDRVRMRSWFRRAIVPHLQPSRWIVLIVWDTDRNEGFELIGRVEDIGQHGERPASRVGGGPGPAPVEVEVELLVRIEKISPFGESCQDDGES